MTRETWKVGELARRTGLTVRALHHYDAIGLLKPSSYSGSGYRLYTARDVARLQRILALRQAGLTLAEIRDCLDRPGSSPLEVIRLQAARLRERTARERRLCERLEAVAARLQGAEEVSADELIGLIREMTMLEGYYTPEQTGEIQARAEQRGPEGLERSHEEWADLIARVRAEMDRGTDPSSPEVQAMARRWTALVDAFTGGDPEVGRSAARLWQERGDEIADRHGSQSDPRPVMEYIGRAMAAARGRA